MNRLFVGFRLFWGLDIQTMVARSIYLFHYPKYSYNLMVYNYFELTAFETNKWRLFSNNCLCFRPFYAILSRFYHFMCYSCDMYTHLCYFFHILATDTSCAALDNFLSRQNCPEWLENWLLFGEDCNWVGLIYSIDSWFCIEMHFGGMLL